LQLDLQKDDSLTARAEPLRKPMMLSLRIAEGQQITLIHEVHSDDAHLLNTIDGEWFDILYQFPWQAYRQVAADYYSHLICYPDSILIKQHIEFLEDEKMI
jgi:hypothetical protein